MSKSSKLSLSIPNTKSMVSWSWTIVWHTSSAFALYVSTSNTAILPTLRVPQYISQATTFPLRSFSQWRIQSTSQKDQDFLQETTFQRESRAGEDGYSLLRRPVTFDADKDPVFDAPKVLDERLEKRRLDTDLNWYESRLYKNSRDITNDQNDMLWSDSTLLSSEKHQRQDEEYQQLDMYQRTLDTLDYPLVLKALANECRTIPGKEIVLASITPNSAENKTNPSESSNDDNEILTMSLTASTVDGVQRRFRALQEMKRLMEGTVTGWISSTRESLKHSQTDHPKRKRLPRKPLGRPPIDGCSFDLRPIFNIVDQGKVLEGPEILDITTMLEIAMDVIDWTAALRQINEEIEGSDGELQQQPFLELPKLTSAINVNPTLFDLLTNAFDDEGRLSGVTFPGIGRLRAKVRTFKRDILASIDSLLAIPSMREKLAVESGGSLTMEINGRLVIPVQQKYQSLGIVHDASRSGKTVYVEPTSIVGPTNELRQAEAELRAEEARVWRQLTEAIVQHRSEIERNIASIAQLDVVMGRVKLGKRLKGVVPTVAEQGVVCVKEARHPILLLRELQGVVGSDVEIGNNGNQGLILTGPNSGGKTVILKLLGLFALMVRDGIPIPSKSNEPARVDFFNPVLADIGDLQSVDGDLSTFSGHMLVCREVLNNAQKDALILMDELGSGTDPNQGVAIAQAILEALLDRGCRVAITTHYLELKQLASIDSRFAVAGMQFLGGRPTYKLIPGMIGESFALAVAERLNLPNPVIQRANELLDTDTRKMGELIRDLEEQKLLVEHKAEELKKQEFEILELRAEMKRQQERLEAKQLNARREEAKKFAAKLEEKERLLENILEKLKGSGASKKVVAESWSDIRIVKREALAEAENLPGIMSRLQHQYEQLEDVELIPISELKGGTKLNVGDTVIVCKKGAFYGKEGVVKESGNKILVSVDGVGIRLTTKEIAFQPSSGWVQGANRKGTSEEKLSKMAKRGLEYLDPREDSTSDISPSLSSKDGGITMRISSNTVNCIGKTFEESKRKSMDVFSKATMNNQSIVFIMHGHGTGILRQKIRTWLASERQWVKSFRAAEPEDGGEAVTRVELKKQNLI